MDDTLREKERLLSEIQRTARIGTWRQDMEGRIVWSEELYHVFGMSRETFISNSESLIHLTHPQDQTLMQAWIQDCLTAKEPGELEFRILLPDESIRFICARGWLLYDEKGQPTHLSGTAQDITGRKQLEAELREKNLFIESMLNASPDFIYIYDIEGKRNVYLNKGIYNILGYTEKEVQAMGSDINQTLMHPDDFKSYVEHTLPRYATVKENELIQHHYRMKSKDGQWRRLSSKESIFLRKEDQTPKQIFALVKDITESIEAEESLVIAHERLRCFVDANIVGIVIANAAGKIIETNDYYLNVLGFTREQFEQGLVDWRSVTPADWLPADEKAIQELREHGRCTPYEKEYLCRNGSRVPVFLAKAILPGKEEKTVAFVLDLTELKRAEQEIHKLNRELEDRVIRRTAELKAANQELEAFSYSVSHDLRAPLRAVSGYIQILLEDFSPDLDDEGKRICHVIRDNAANMGVLIDDLLAFSRLSKSKIVMSTIDMERLVASIFNELTTPEIRDRMEITVTSLPHAIGDTTLIRQVWTNLIDNAIKFSSRKERTRIKISSTRQGVETSYSIQDNGAGFDMQYVDKLFGVFQRLHSIKEFKGTGVGLAIVQRIILRHGGKVWAEGKIDQGATFHFTLKTGD